MRQNQQDNEHRNIIREQKLKNNSLDILKD